MKRLDDETHGFQFVPPPGMPEAMALELLLVEAIRVTTEQVSAGRSVDLGSVEVFLIPAPLLGTHARVVGWTLRTRDLHSPEPAAAALKAVA